MRRTYAFVATHSVAVYAALNMAVATFASALFIAPSLVTAALLAAGTAVSIALWSASIKFERYPDWRSFGPAGLSYMAVWAIIETGHGRLGPLVLPDWFWQPIQMPYVGATTPGGMVVPLGASVLLAIAAQLWLRRSGYITLWLLALDVFAINIYLLLASDFPQAGLEVTTWAAAILTSGLAAWQIVWLPPSRRHRRWEISVPMSVPPADVFSLLSDLKQRTRWMRSVESDHLLEGNDSERGAVYLETLRSGRNGLRIKVRIADKVPTRRLTIDALAPYVGSEEYEVAPMPQGSQVSLAHRWEVSYALCLIGGRWWWLRWSDRERRERRNLGALASALAPAATAARAIE